MNIPIQHPGFEGRKLTLFTETQLRNAKIMIDGRALPLTNGCYLVRNNDGEQVIIRIKETSFFPEVFIDGEKIEIAWKLSQYEWLGGFIPLLVCLGGPLWTLFGVVFCFLSLGIYRSQLPPRMKLMLFVTTSLFPLMVFFLILGSSETPLIGW